MTLTRLLIGLYILGVGISLPVFYDEEDLWFLVWCFLWPVLLFGAMVGTFTGSLALLLEKLTKPKKDDDGR